MIISPESTLKIISEEEVNLARIERKAASLLGRKYLVYEIFDLRKQLMR
jgi:hypothetical protein